MTLCCCPLSALAHTVNWKPRVKLSNTRSHTYIVLHWAICPHTHSHTNMHILKTWSHTHSHICIQDVHKPGNKQTNKHTHTHNSADFLWSHTCYISLSLFLLVSLFLSQWCVWLLLCLSWQNRNWSTDRQADTRMKQTSRTSVRSRSMCDSEAKSRTKGLDWQTIWIHHLGLWKIIVGSFYYFLKF